MKTTFQRGCTAFLIWACLGCQATPQAENPLSNEGTAVASAAPSVKVQGSAKLRTQTPQDISVKVAVLSGRYALNDQAEQAAFSGTIEHLVDTYQFEKLEKLAAEFRTETEPSPGYPINRLTSFYFSLKDPSNQPFENRLSRLRDWAKGRPEAVEPRIAALRLLCRVKQDGIRPQSTGFNESQQALQKPMKEADRVYESLRLLGDKARQDPEFYSAALEYLSLIEHDSEEAEQLFREGLKVAPHHISLHGRYALYRRSQGHEYQPTTEDPLTQIMVEWLYLKEMRGTWERKRRLFLEAVQQAPHSNYLLNLFAHSAHEARDFDTSQQVLQNLKLRHESYIWTLPAHLEARRAAGLSSDLSQADLRPLRELEDELNSPRAADSLLRRNIALLWYQEQFETLDSMADELRDEGTRFEHGGQKLTLVYDALRDSGINGEPLSAHLARSRRWLEQNPESTTAKVLRSYLLVRFAWNARGGGYASTVTEHGWEVFYSSLQEAQEILAPLVAGAGPYDTLMLETAAHLGVGLHLEKSYMEELVQKALKNDPYTSATQRIMNQYLQERWHGRAGDREAFMKTLPDTVYADLVWRNEEARLVGKDEEVQLDWYRVNRGLTEKAQAFDVERNWSQALASALNLGDKKLSQVAIQALGKRTPRTLESLSHWAPLKAWAAGEGSWPLGPFSYTVMTITPKERRQANPYQQYNPYRPYQNHNIQNFSRTKVRQTPSSGKKP